MTEEIHVCLRGILLPDGSGSIQVIARGTQAECQAVADQRPPDMEINRRLIAYEEFSVISERRHLEVNAEASRMFPNEPKGMAGGLLEPRLETRH